MSVSSARLRRSAVFVLFGVFGMAGAPSAAEASRALYTGNKQAASVSQFTVDAATGALTAMSPASVATTGAQGRIVSVSPNGKWAYIANTGTGGSPGQEISQYSVDPATGALTAMSPASAPSGNGPIGTAVTPNNKFLFAAESYAGDLRSFTIDQSTGALTPLATITTGGSMQKLQITPDGRFLYATDFNSGGVRQFALDQATGALTPMSPALVAAGSRPVPMAMSLDAKHLYVSDTNGAAVYQFDIDQSTGALTPMASPTIALPSNPRGLAVSTDGLLYVGDNSATGRISTFTIDPTTGQLSSAQPVVTTSGATLGVALTGSGRFLYATDATNGSVSLFAATSLGVLTPLSPAQATAGAQAWGVTLSPNQGPTGAVAAAAGATGASIALDASGSTDDSAVARYDWDFGDGNTASNAGASPSHTYAAAGTFTASVHVTDNDGCSDTPIWSGTTVYCRPSGATTATNTVTVYGTPTITSVPSGAVSSTSASVAFTVPASLPAECKLDGGAWASCTSPKALTGLSEGSHTVNVRSGNGAGAFGAAVSATWTVDTGVPTATTISGGPANSSTIATGAAAFTFGGATDGGSGVAGYECKLDGGAWTACTSPRALTGLADGTHTFQARAVDAAGNAGAPDSTGWTVDTTAPTTSVSSAPASPTNSTSASVAFSSTDGTATFECKLDAGAYAACTSPRSFTGLAEGSHTVSIRGTDPVGNLGTPATATWTVDTTAPGLTLSGAPTSPTTATGASIGFSSTDGSATFECKRDSAAYVACTSPATLAAVGVGDHTFTVRATDPAGNTTTQQASWTVSAIPETVITAGPPAGATVQDPSFTFTDPMAVRYECQIDGGAWVACTSPAQPALTDGSHTFTVRGIDANGGASTAAPLRTLIVDTVAPRATADGVPSGSTFTDVLAATFSANEPGVQFRCVLDGAELGDCTAGLRKSPMAPGLHTLLVFATDVAGNRDSSPMRLVWTVSEDYARPSVKSAGGKQLTCVDSKETAELAVGHAWSRDHEPIAGATKRTYAIGPKDDARTLACATTIRLASGATHVVGADPVALLGARRLRSVHFAATVPVNRSATTPQPLTFALSRSGTVLVRLMCREGVVACKLPSGRLDYRRAVAARAALTEKPRLGRVDRIIVRGQAGTNSIDVRALLPPSLKTGDYKLSVRLRGSDQSGRTAALATPINAAFKVVPAR